MLRACKSSLLTAALLTPAAVPALAQDDMAVVASIKPIHSLVASVMAGVGEPALLVRGGDSPHTYALRPSDAQALERAGIVFWVGEGMERFLADAIETVAADAVSVELGEVDGLVLLEARAGGTWEAHAHEEEDEDEEEHAADHDDAHAGDEDHANEHDHGTVDTHVWLDPVNAKAMVTAIAAALAAGDPAHAVVYEDNAAATVARLDDLVAEIDAIVAPVRHRPFIVFHDAYHAMENRFGLNGVGSITITPDIQPGAARLQEIRDRIAELGAVCVFAEPQFQSSLVETVTEGSAARAAVLDPLGADLADGPDLYFELMRRNARSLRDCLAD